MVSTPLKNKKCSKYIEWLFPIYGKIKNVPNHQTEYCWFPSKNLAPKKKRTQSVLHHFRRRILCSWVCWCLGLPIGSNSFGTYHLGMVYSIYGDFEGLWSFSINQSSSHYSSMIIPLLIISLGLPSGYDSHTVAIEHGHSKSELSHERWWICPVRYINAYHFR